MARPLIETSVGDHFRFASDDSLQTCSFRDLALGSSVVASLVAWYLATVTEVLNCFLVHSWNRCLQQRGPDRPRIWHAVHVLALGTSKSVLAFSVVTLSSPSFPTVRDGLLLPTTLSSGFPLSRVQDARLDARTERLERCLMYPLVFLCFYDLLS